MPNAQLDTAGSEIMFDGGGVTILVEPDGTHSMCVSRSESTVDGILDSMTMLLAQDLTLVAAHPVASDNDLVGVIVFDDTYRLVWS